MLPELLQKTNLYELLFLIDCDFSETVKNKGCLFCNGVLHQADYPRKPRGPFKNLPEEYQKRHSLCCSCENCRKRALPPSCRFMGRKVYFWPVILIVMALRQNRKDSYSAGRLMRLFNISRNTLKRWFKFFKDCFPLLPQWQRVRGLIPTSIGNHEIPGSLLFFYLNRFNGKEMEALLQCLIVLTSEGDFSVKIDGFRVHAEDG
jgi:hypothetical protein